MGSSSHQPEPTGWSTELSDEPRICTSSGFRQRFHRNLVAMMLLLIATSPTEQLVWPQIICISGRHNIPKIDDRALSRSGSQIWSPGEEKRLASTDSSTETQLSFPWVSTPPPKSDGDEGFM
jgi:hypothetical protein